MIEWIIAAAVCGAICAWAWWAWTAEWYHKLMCWVEIVFLCALACLCVVMVMACIFAFNPIALVFAAVFGVIGTAAIWLASKVHKMIDRGY